ncbi:MAG: hypothetical protein K9G49_01650 [Taibaiella sp.]|nr:hypothetical protein [Taibaiella sp.]
MNFVRRKTKERFTIGLLDPAKAILDYYKKQDYYNKDGYIFPILSENYKTAKSIDYRMDRMLKIANSDLKDITTLG